MVPKAYSHSQGPQPSATGHESRRDHERLEAGLGSGVIDSSWRGFLVRLLVVWGP